MRFPRRARHRGSVLCALLSGLVEVGVLGALGGCSPDTPVQAQAKPSATQAPAPNSPANAPAQDPAAVLREHVRRDEVDAALAQLDTLTRGHGDAPGYQYLRARLHERKQHIKEALASLPEDTSNLPDEVVQDIRRRRAYWQASEGYCEQAAPAVKSLDTGDASLTLRVAECALAHADPNAALSLLRDVRSSARRRFEVRLTLSQALEQTGDKPGAIRELRALYVDYPEHTSASRVLAKLQELHGSFRPTDDERFARAQRWLDVARPEEALQDLAQVALPPANSPKDRQAQRAARARLLHLKGMALFRSRKRYAEASKVLTQAAAMGGATEAEDAFHAAQAMARADRDRDAVKAYYRFAKTYPKDHLATSALHNAAWLELRHDLPGGEAHMQAFLKRAERSRSKRALSEPLWQLAQHAFNHRRYSQGLPLFERYATTGEGSMVKARGLYWAGRCAALSGKPELALRHYREAMAVEPLHWYALLARGRIAAAGAEAGPALPAEITPHAPLPDQIEPVALPSGAAFYAQLGLDDDAVGVLRAQEASWRRHGNTGLVPLLAAYHTLGEYTRPYQIAARERQDTLVQPAGPEQRAIWTALYPRPYASVVLQAAKHEQIAPEIVYGVMRRESAFKAKVVSYADAIGLLQLIEPTARANAAAIGLKPFERNTLFDPSANIRIGTHYLAQLIEHYHGQPVPAIAAYNAGEHKVDEWIKRATRRGKQVDLDWFVEDIPFEQTRNYVRLVVTSWARYAFLEQPDAAWPITLPLTLTP